jgi:ferredoxin-NADP reductase
MQHNNHNMHGHLPTNHSMPSMKKAAFEVALKDKKQIAEGTIAFVFEKPKDFHFKAGQHMRMTLINPPETDSEGNSRFFSLANSPQEKDLVIAMRMRDTAFKRILKDLKIGGKVLIEILLDSPHGSFALHDDPSIPAVFLIGGIGIVPAFSMIKDAIERKLPHTIFLFYLNRRVEDAPFLNELEQMAAQNPSFKLIAIMTKHEKSAKSWPGVSGHIDTSMLQKHLDDLKSPIYYIAGLPEMVTAMKTMLASLGVNEDNMRAEEFTGFNLNEIHNANSRKGRSHVLFAVIGLVILAVVILHAAAAISINNIGLDAFFVNSPISYFIMGISLVVAAFKLKLLLGFMQRKKEWL